MASVPDDEEGDVHRELLTDGTVLAVTIKRRPGGWVSRFGIDGSRCREADSPFFGVEHEEVVLVDGEELGDRATAPRHALDILVPHTSATLSEDGSVAAAGLAVAGRAPPGSSSVIVEGSDQRFRVDSRTGLFCAGRWWRPAPHVAVLDVRTDDPSVEPHRWEESPARWREMLKG